MAEREHEAPVAWMGIAHLKLPGYIVRWKRRHVSSIAGLLSQ